uniref:Uncharacterized protein n=1 Tax=Arundo donax TaxID=35708 RepID=A0A0A9GSL5_ARUDO
MRPGKIKSRTVASSTPDAFLAARASSGDESLQEQRNEPNRQGERSTTRQERVRQ